MKPQTINCEQLRELLPAYGMGITDPEETRLVEDLLPLCPEAAKELDHYHQMTDDLLLSVPQIEPPAALLNHILDKTETRSAAWPFRQVLLAAAVALLLALNGVLLLQLLDLNQRYDTLSRQLDSRTALLANVARDDLLTFELIDARESAPVAGGRLLCHPQERSAILQVENFPPLDQNMVYQVWLIRDDHRTSGGLFEVDATGRGTLVIDSPLPMGEYQYVGITPEPVGGSDGPTALPIVRGALY
jgi:hypothetical protein